MPSKSKAQFRLFQAAAAKPALARRLGIKPKTAKEWASEDRKRGAKGLPEKKK